MTSWWREAVVYQVYPRSFADSDGDGVGDLRGLRVLLDLVPNHTSIEHPWFLDHPERYVWADPASDGGPPNNWLSLFGGGPAWTRDPASGRFYLHSFLPEQPDLDWWNKDVRAAFDDILRFWLDRGVDGFRIDVAAGMIKDRALRDNPSAEAGDHAVVRALGQRQHFNMDRPEVHDVLRRWRAIRTPTRTTRSCSGRPTCSTRSGSPPTTARTTSSTSPSTSSCCTRLCRPTPCARCSGARSGPRSRAPTTMPAGSPRAGPAATTA
jgi:hypothetical protein